MTSKRNWLIGCLACLWIPIAAAQGAEKDPKLLFPATSVAPAVVAEWTIKDHPRLFWRDDAKRRAATAPDVLKGIVGASGTKKASTNRMLCRAIRYRLGEAAYGPLAVADLLSLKVPKLDVHHGLGHIQPHAIAYDWLYDLLTDEQRVAVRKTVYEGLQGGKYWSGYNYDAGIGMISALAIEGDVREGEEIPTGLVRKYWEECWWSRPADGKTNGGLYNREYERNWQPDGGVREGWSYMSDQADIVACRGAWESATGDTQSLDFPWLNRMPLLLLHQCRNPIMWSLPCFTYGSDALYQNGFANIIQASTGNRDPTIAAISAWLYQQNAKVFSTRTAAEVFIYRILIGDPTVKPQSPAELGLPLLYTTQRTGYVYDRTSWDEDATRVFFGCQEVLTRDFPMGDVMVTNKGRVLLGSRNALYRHHYSPPFVRNLLLLYQGDKLIMPAKGSSDPVREVICTMRRKGDTWIAETQGLYSKPKVDLVRRTWSFDRSTQKMTVTDEVRCPAGIIPRIGWNTPEKPEIEGDRITFVSGPASCRMSFDTKPAEILLRGGETDFLWSEDYAGNIDKNAKGDLTREFSKRDRAKQILTGGFYTVYVTPPTDPKGTFRLTTTIEVKD